MTDELQFARAFAADAGQQIRRLLREGFRVDTKADQSPVTTADTLINDRFIHAVRTRFPGDAVLGEEASRPTGSARTWVIDPIDGTQQFLLGIPVFMVSIALVVDGTPVVAVASNPSTRETFWATAGGGSFRDGTRLTVSPRTGATESAIVCGAGAVASGNGLNADTLLRVRTDPLASAPVRFPWPSVFSGCKVAEGAWDADLYSGNSPHDVAAVCLLVREAGGVVTDRRGADQRYDREVNGCLLSNGRLHDALVDEWSATYLARQR